MRDPDGYLIEVGQATGRISDRPHFSPNSTSERAQGGTSGSRPMTNAGRQAYSPHHGFKSRLNALTDGKTPLSRHANKL
jgi:hypothetical protein